jgi:hypothetical protein
MLLTLCYVCPPLAVLFMGRPFGMMLNMFMIFGGWNNMVKHALVCYADRRGSQYVGKVNQSINQPAWTKQFQQPQQQVGSSAPRLIDDPCVGANGTVFKRKHD